MSSPAAGMYCTALLDDLLVGIPIGQVQEILRTIELTPVPLAAPSVVGVVNLRGQIVTALDLRRRLHRPERDPGATVRGIVVATRFGSVTLLVDDIGEVVNCDAELFEATPTTLSASLRAWIRGAYKLQTALLLVLDVDAVADVGRDAPDVS